MLKFLYLLKETKLSRIKSNNIPDPREFIVIRGAKVNNLKNIDLDIPKYKLIVFTGVSGSGKSSIVFDTIYAEGQRRYVESLSSYARQFLERMNKPDVEFISGLAPSMAIEQKAVAKTGRSTVGTSTEIYDYLRLLYARIGDTISPISNSIVTKDYPNTRKTEYMFTAHSAFRARISLQKKYRSLNRKDFIKSYSKMK